MHQQLVIGVDLDNTLVCYDELFHRAACEEGLIDPALPKHKEAVRDAIRRLPEGETKWTTLQALVYGMRMSEAPMFEGADVFLRHCAGKRARVRIVSHKSRHATWGGAKLDLRQSALQWIEANGFFSHLGLSRGDVFFEDTRAEKINRIRALSCTHFIDDLPEVFAEELFPPETRKLLFAASAPARRGAPGQPPAFASWFELDRFLFNDGGS
jgi:hypothetical protein